MRTSFHHQPEAQHPNFQLSTSWQADYPIFWGEADVHGMWLRWLRSQMTHMRHRSVEWLRSVLIA
jgi:hypothetical protein